MSNPTTPPTLSVSNLSVRYDNQTALHDLTLDIRAGELVGVIGPNGAGKTSFIKALCGHVRVNGVISILGVPIKKGQDRRQSIGLVPQEIGLYAELTAQENLDVIARLLGIKNSARKQSISNALRAVGMADKAKLIVQNMSGGMKRRINVAAAIMHDPAVIIFDEPTAGIDVPARDNVHRLARDLANKGKAVILITHELEQAEILCDKILLLVQGQKRAFASPIELLSRSYGEEIHVTLRLAATPCSQTTTALIPFGFTFTDKDKVSKAILQSDLPSFVSEISSIMDRYNNEVREMNYHRPGLTELMHDITIEQSAAS